MIRKCIALFCLFTLMTGVRAQSPPTCPCCTETHQQFAFWLGDWEVTRADNGKSAGSNHIVSLHDSCLMQENWQSASSTFEGSSYNFYNAVTEEWSQVWVDNSGFILEMKGKLVGEAMVLSTGQVRNAKGESVIHRVTWTPQADKSVVQHWEMSKDVGQSWSTLFKGIYRKKKD